ncbi:hypothetical protein [Snodgrassella gandavensis]|uniref:hypothetical protein n=1 Tax=Snodgrassella gandavensis TaxID=2946698 RepID=UPI001EF4728B|nr:hypothetical protein [Snodgrassella gandavensis]
MARKVWAYAKDKNHQFIYEKQAEQLKIFYIWDVLRLKARNPDEYKELKFYSTEFDEINRLELTASEHGFFKYKSEQIDEETRESIYHSTAMLILMEMSEINFTIDNDNYLLTFSKFLVEPCLRFKHFDKDEEKYYPDLVGYFADDCELYDKWHGCVAIEVVFTNNCHSKKVNSFEKNHIPIIEVSISEKLKLGTEFCGEIKFTVADVEKYYHALKKMFANKVFGKIRSDPVSKKFYQNEIDNLQNSHQQNLIALENKQQLHHAEKLTLERQFNLLNIEHEKMKAEMSKLQSLMEQMRQREWHLNNRLNYYTTMGFWQKLKLLFQNPVD